MHGVFSGIRVVLFCRVEGGRRGRLNGHQRLDILLFWFFFLGGGAVKIQRLSSTGFAGIEISFL